jgi:reactive intermediate/imine deaminase
MTDRQIIATENAPAAIGTYSQAVRVGDTVYISGQIPLDPATMEVCSQVFADQTRQVFDNLAAVAQAAGGDLSDIVKLSIFMTDLSHFPTVNEIMADYFQLPYPARAAVGVKELPKAVQIEMEAIMAMGTIK